MNESGSDANKPLGSGDGMRVTREIAAEAAVWVTILHGSERDQRMENGLRAWLSLSPAHREAFEKTTDVWMAIPQALQTLQIAEERRRIEARQRVRKLWMRCAIVGGTVVVVLCAAMLFQHW